MSVGFLYATYYMCRYNFRFAVPGLQKEFGFDIDDISLIFAMWSTAYGLGQLINGLFSDVIGGKKSLLIGGIATILINLVFGFSSLIGNFFSLALLSTLNGYMQSFGAPGLIKVNAAWFQKNERGLFSGIFGGVIQLGQISISQLAPALLNSGLVIGAFVFMESGDWRSVFKLPPFFAIIAVIFCWIYVKESPEEAGYAHTIEDDVDNTAGVRVSLKHSLNTMLTHPLIWYYAIAYACTGGVRHSLDQLSILYFRDQLGFNMENDIPWVASFTLMAMPFFAFLGSLGSGLISDRYYNGERGYLSMILYFLKAASILIAALVMQSHLAQQGPWGVFLGCSLLVLVAMTVNSTHSLVGAAAPMDIGGKKMAGFATGIIDSFQYFGGAISFLVTGYVLKQTQAEYGYLFWYLIMALFGVLGGLVMALMIRKKNHLTKVLV